MVAGGWRKLHYERHAATGCNIGIVDVCSERSKRPTSIATTYLPCAVKTFERGAFNVRQAGGPFRLL